MSKWELCRIKEILHSRGKQNERQTTDQIQCQRGCGEKVQSINEWVGGWRNGSAVKACAALRQDGFQHPRWTAHYLSVTPAPGGSDAFCGFWWYQVCIRCTYST